MQDSCGLYILWRSCFSHYLGQGIVALEYLSLSLEYDGIWNINGQKGGGCYRQLAVTPQSGTTRLWQKESPRNRVLLQKAVVAGLP